VDFFSVFWKILRGSVEGTVDRPGNCSNLAGGPSEGPPGRSVSGFSLRENSDG